MAFMVATSSAARAQTPIATIALGPDQIGVVKTAVGITTRITFPEPVQEIICGDLYDAATGKGTFVVQRSGSDQKPGNDVFIKPVATKGLSNMFVKAGEGKHTYNFDLKIVPVDQAHRVVNVTDAPSAPAAQPRDNQPGTPGTSSAPSTAQPPSNGEQHVAEPDKSNRNEKPAPAPDFERQKAEAEQQARQKADEIIRTARQQADRIVGEAEAKVLEADRHSSTRADKLSEQRFMQALILGLREAKISNSRATTKKKVVVMLDPRMLMFDDKAYLRYTIQNAGSEDFAFNSVSLEAGEGNAVRLITAEVTQSKPENKLAPGESLTGVITFDPKQTTSKDRLTLFVRGEDSTEIAHVTIQ
jgi:vacuolar-type H+-ATPase subunit H